jgi:hypothetical protein
MPMCEQGETQNAPSPTPNHTRAAITQAEATESKGAASTPESQKFAIDTRRSDLALATTTNDVASTT